MRKIALIVYHKNISTLYPWEWIDKYRESILKQTHRADIFELNYGSLGERIFEQSQYITKECPTFVHGMNYLIELILNKGYDYIINTNVDDFYSFDRIQKQLFWLEQGYDIVSSNFMLVRGNGSNYLRQEFHEMNLETELLKGHNIIAHPSVCYSKNFFSKCQYIPEEIPKEDLLLWQRGIKEEMKFKIVPEILLYHRLHDKMVSGVQTDRTQII